MSWALNDEQRAIQARARAYVYVLNGTKYWITGGGVSRMHLVFASTSATPRPRSRRCRIWESTTPI